MLPVGISFTAHAVRPYPMTTTRHQALAWGMWLLAAAFSVALGQGPVFLDCQPDVILLCVKDEGVRLPANNQLFLGNGHPDATSCSVHLNRTKKVKSDCPGDLQYRVEFIPEGTTQPIVLKDWTSVTPDSTQEAIIDFDTEGASDEQIRLAGLGYNSICAEYHRIRWTVNDDCGLEVVCEEQIQIYDCQPAQVEVISGFATLPDPGTNWYWSIWAIDFVIEERDDCNSEDLLYSFSPDFYQPDTMMDYCDAPAFQVVIPWYFWVADAGHDLNCDGHIEWGERNIRQDTFYVMYLGNGWIDCAYPYYVSGSVKSWKEKPVDSVIILNAEYMSPFWPIDLTDQEGEFNYDKWIQLGIQEQASVCASKNDPTRDGISTIDLVRIQSHLLGRRPFEHPLQYLAADVNNSQSVSAIDLVELRKFILGVLVPWNIMGTWKFFPADSFLLHPDPFQLHEISPCYHFLALKDSSYALDFTGALIGDVNGSFMGNFQNIDIRSEQKVRMVVEDVSWFRNDLIEVPVYVSDKNDIQGFQFTLTHPGLDLVDVQSGVIEFTGDETMSFGDRSTISWYILDPVVVSADEPVFTLVFKANAPGRLSQSLRITSDITAAEFYPDENTVLTPELTFHQDQNTQIDHPLTVIPNPVSDRARILLPASITDPVDLRCYNSVGQLVYVANEIQPINQEINIVKNEIKGTGWINVLLQAEDQIFSTRFLIPE